MSSTTKDLTFVVTRRDLHFDFAQKFEDVFRFRVDDGDTFSSDQGVRKQEPQGYDFRSELTPEIHILPPGELIEESTSLNSEDFAVYVAIEDIGLNIRRVVQRIEVAELTEPRSIKIDLTALEDMGFYRGFVVRCFISPSKDTDQDKSKIWSKSHILFGAEFIVKSTLDDALFEINYKIFSDELEKKHVLFYVDWLSNQVSSEPHTDCFEVVANYDLKPQMKRLENNSIFGEFCIRMMAERIISELAENTMRCADLENEPTEGSLHEKMQALFNEFDMDFDDLARRYQQGKGLEVLEIVTSLSRAMQRYSIIGSTLNSVKFGGFRRS